MQRFINNWSASLLQPLAADATTLVVDPSAAARLVWLGGGDYYLLTLIGTDELGNEITWEIVRVTAAVSGSLTIERAQEGTAARAWPTAAAIEMRITAGAMAGLRDTSGPQGPAGPQGDPGMSAYGVALIAGFVGTEAEWLASLRGDDGQDGAVGASAYEIAVASGFVGDEATWLASLQGEPGVPGEQGPAGPQGPTGDGLQIIGTLPSTGDLPAIGEAGDGYLIAGHLWVWSVDQWVDAGLIQGPQGPAGPTGPVGATGAAGADGASAYQIALVSGFVGSEAEWLLSLKGEQGEQGPPGTSGAQSIIIACSDETTALTAGTAKVTFRMPYPFVLLGVRASLTAAQVSGNILTVDLNEDGVSVLSTKLTVDNGKKTSTTAATAAVISDSALADDAEMTVDIDQIGDGTARGLKITLLGYRP